MPFRETKPLTRPSGPAERWLRRLFIEDWNLKLLALGITLVLWFVVSGHGVEREVVVEPRTSSQTVEILAAVDIDSLDDVVRDMNAGQVETVDGRACSRAVAAVLVIHRNYVGHRGRQASSHGMTHRPPGSLTQESAVHFWRIRKDGGISGPL